MRILGRLLIMCRGSMLGVSPGRSSTPTFRRRLRRGGSEGHVIDPQDSADLRDCSTSNLVVLIYLMIVLKIKRKLLFSFKENPTILQMFTYFLPPQSPTPITHKIFKDITNYQLNMIGAVYKSSLSFPLKPRGIARMFSFLKSKGTFLKKKQQLQQELEQEPQPVDLATVEKSAHQLLKGPSYEFIPANQRPLDATRSSIFFHPQDKLPGYKQHPQARVPQPQFPTSKQLSLLSQLHNYYHLKEFSKLVAKFEQNQELVKKYPELYLKGLVEVDLRRAIGFVKEDMSVGLLQIVLDKVVREGKEVEGLVEVLRQKGQAIAGRLTLNGLNKFVGNAKGHQISTQRLDFLVSLLEVTQGKINIGINMKELLRKLRQSPELFQYSEKIQTLINPSFEVKKDFNIGSQLTKLVQSGDVAKILGFINETPYDEQLKQTFQDVVRSARLRLKKVPISQKQLIVQYGKYRCSGNTKILDAILTLASQSKTPSIVLDMYQNYQLVFNCPRPQSLVLTYLDTLLQLPLQSPKPLLQLLSKTPQPDRSRQIKSLLLSNKRQLAASVYQECILAPVVKLYQLEHIRLFLYHYYVVENPTSEEAAWVDTWVMRLSERYLMEVWEEENVVNNQIARFSVQQRQGKEDKQKGSREGVVKEEANMWEDFADEKNLQEFEEKEFAEEQKLKRPLAEFEKDLKKMSSEVIPFTSETFWKEAIKQRRIDDLFKLEKKGSLNEVQFSQDYNNQVHFKLSDFKDLLVSQQTKDQQRLQFQKSMQLYLLQLESIMFGLMDQIDDIYLNRFTALVQTATPEMIKVLNFYNIYMFDVIRSDQLLIIRIIQEVRDNDFRSVDEIRATRDIPFHYLVEDVEGIKEEEEDDDSKQEYKHPYISDNQGPEHHYVGRDDLDLQTIEILKQQCPFLWQQTKTLVRLPSAALAEQFILWGVEHSSPMAIHMGQKIAMLTGQVIPHDLAKRVQQILSLKNPTDPAISQLAKESLSILGPVDRSNIYSFYKEYTHIFERTDYEAYLQYLDEYTFYPHRYLVLRERAKSPVRWHNWGMDYGDLLRSMSQQYAV